MNAMKALWAKHFANKRKGSQINLAALSDEIPVIGIRLILQSL